MARRSPLLCPSSLIVLTGLILAIEMPSWLGQSNLSAQQPQSRQDEDADASPPPPKSTPPKLAAPKSTAPPPTEPSEQPASADDPPISDANAEEPPKPPTAKQAFNAALDRLEQEVADLEQKTKYGQRPVELYAAEVAEQYDSIAKLIADKQIEDYHRLTPTEQQSFDRLNRLSIKLWYLEYIGTRLFTDEESTRTISRRAHELIKDHTEAMRDPVLSKRFRDLTQRAMQLNHRRFLSRYRNVFHFTTPSRQPNSVDDNPAVMQHSIESLREPLSRLLRLTFDGETLTLDRDHWELSFGGTTLTEIDEAVTAELNQRDIEVDTEDRSFDYQKRQLLGHPPQVLLFLNFQYYATRDDRSPRISLRTRSPVNSLRFQSEELEASFVTSPTKFELFVRETTSDLKQILQLSHQADGSMMIRIIGERNFQLEQLPGGKVRWIDIGVDTHVYEAESFAELYAQSPDEVETNLLPYLDRFGILPPLTRFDPLVTSRVIEMLKIDIDQAQSEVRRLIEQMESGSFSQRQTAYRQLTNQIERFAIVMDQLPEHQLSSPELAARLDEVRKKYQSQYREVDGLILRSNWLTDRNYLGKLLEQVSDANKPFIRQQLDKLAP